MKRFSFQYQASGDPAQLLMEVIRTARGFASDSGLSAELSTRLVIVVEELVTNVVKHGLEVGIVTVEGRLELHEQGVSFVLEDNGIAFDPRAHPDPGGPHPVTGGGAGIPLVRAWADIREYRRERDRNRLELVVRG